MNRKQRINCLVRYFELEAALVTVVECYAEEVVFNFSFRLGEIFTAVLTG